MKYFKSIHLIQKHNACASIKIRIVETAMFTLITVLSTLITDNPSDMSITAS